MARASRRAPDPRRRRHSFQDCQKKREAGYMTSTAMRITMTAANKSEIIGATLSISLRRKTILTILTNRSSHEKRLCVL
jgi:hypothetical protein